MQTGNKQIQFFVCSFILVSFLAASVLYFRYTPVQAKYRVYVSSSYICLNGHVSTWAELISKLDRERRLVKAEIVFDDLVRLSTVEDKVFALAQRSFPEFGFSVTNKPSLNVIIKEGCLLFPAAEVMCFKVASQKVFLGEKMLTYDEFPELLKNKKDMGLEVRVDLSITSTTTAADFYTVIDIARGYASSGVVWKR